MPASRPHPIIASVSNSVLFIATQRQICGSESGAGGTYAELSKNSQFAILAKDWRRCGLAQRLKRYGLEKTKASVTNKLARETFAATFLLDSLADLESDGVRLEDD
ncbi:MAG: DUF6471 domain-containing protein [Rhizomicrobium sp.]